MERHRYYLPLLALLLLFSLPSHAEDKTERFEAADSEGVTATRDDSTLYLKLDADVQSPITIPRLAAPLRSMMWQGSITDDGLSLKPEPNHWVIQWKNRPAQDATLMMQFDDEPLLIEELKPIKKSADGSFFLPAHYAVTKGEKIRYEPQPHKNTVGFWTMKEDIAMWEFELDQPGHFNLAILQGCGKGHGGSEAVLMIKKPGHEKVDARIDFEVVETGHFQNFKWVQLGEVELKQTGKIRLGVTASHINKAALMDIRAIHLIRLPEK